MYGTDDKRRGYSHVDVDDDLDVIRDDDGCDEILVGTRTKSTAYGLDLEDVSPALSLAPPRGFA